MIDRTLNYGRHLIERFLRRIGPFQSVLDIGAGHGADLDLARVVNPNARFLAVESYRPSVELLTQKGIKVHPINIEVDRLPFENGKVEVVIANQVLEHTKEIFWICHEITRVLPRGGYLLVGVPNLAALHNRVLLLMGKQPSPIKSASAHVRGFTKQDFLQFLESCFPGGYKLEAFGGSNFYPFPPILAKPFAHIAPTMAWGIFFLLKKTRDYEREFLEYPVQMRLQTNFFVGPSENKLDCEKAG